MAEPNGGTGAGGHMWNIVQMDDGRNYLVDVTNCDEGTIGAPDKLFMAYGPSEVRTNGYTLSWSDGSGSSSIIYTYDSNTIATFGEARLTLSNTAYGVDPVAIIDSASVVFNGKIRLKYYYIIPSELLDSGAEILPVRHGFLYMDRMPSGRNSLRGKRTQEIRCGSRYNL